MSDRQGVRANRDKERNVYRPVLLFSSGTIAVEDGEHAFREFGYPVLSLYLSVSLCTSKTMTDQGGFRDRT